MQPCSTSVVMLTVAILSFVVMTTPVSAAYIFPSDYTPSSGQRGAEDKQLTIVQLRAAVKRLQQLVDTMEPLVSSSVLDSLEAITAEETMEEKRTGKYGPRRYDSYGVAGRFGRSVDRQLMKRKEAM